MTADEKMLFDTAAFIARTMPDSPTIIVDRTAILSAAAVIERAGDVKKLEDVVAKHGRWILGGANAGEIAAAVSRWLLEGGANLR